MHNALPVLPSSLDCYLWHPFSIPKLRRFSAENMYVLHDANSIDAYPVNYELTITTPWTGQTMYPIGYIYPTPIESQRYLPSIPHTSPSIRDRCMAHPCFPFKLCQERQPWTTWYGCRDLGEANHSCGSDSKHYLEAWVRTERRSSWLHITINQSQRSQSVSATAAHKLFFTQMMPIRSNR